MTDLVVIIGPIASGKSTIASALDRRFRAAGRAAAVLDLDDVVDTIGGYGDLTAERFHQAQVVYGELVGAWLRQRVDVIAHGPFFERQEDEALLHAVPDGIEPRRVQLLASYEAALERVTGDPARGLMKDPGSCDSPTTAWSRFCRRCLPPNGSSTRPRCPVGRSLTISLRRFCLSDRRRHVNTPARGLMGCPEGQVDYSRYPDWWSRCDHSGRCPRYHATSGNNPRNLKRCARDGR